MTLLFLDWIYNGRGPHGIGWVYLFFNMSLCILLPVSFILRKLPIFGAIWKFFAIIIGIIFLGSVANMTKKSIKAWWDK